MAIYRLSAQIISRGKGQSAVAAAAYRSRSKLKDTITQEWQDYSPRAQDVLFVGIYAPKDAPEWTRDRAQLWNEVERNENRKNSQLAREIQLALPNELTELQQRYAVQDFVRDNFVKKGLIADVAIHRPHEYGDHRNVHAHIMVTMRQVDTEGWAKHKQRDGKRDDLEVWREQWATIANRHLERHGHEARIDHRSLEEQGIDKEPQIHLGKTAAAMERNGIESDKGTKLIRIAARNALKGNPEERHVPLPLEPDTYQEPTGDAPRHTLFKNFSDAVIQLGRTMASLLLRHIDPARRLSSRIADQVSPTVARPQEQETLLQRLQRNKPDLLAELRETMNRPKAKHRDIEYER